MRLSIKVYDNDQLFAAETPNDGSSEEVLVGLRDVGRRLSVYMEVMADETVEGADRVLEALDWVRTEMQKRRRIYAARDRAKKKKAATRRATQRQAR